MNLPQVEEIIRQILLENAIENVFRGSEKPPSTYVPHQSIFVMHFGGSPPESQMSGGKGIQTHRWDVQILVRSAPENEEDSADTAFTIYDLLRDADLDGDGGWIKADTPPIRLGPDQDDIYRWSINVTCVFEA